MTSKLDLYLKVNKFPFYMPNALTPRELIGEIKIVSGCKVFDRQKKTMEHCKLRTNYNVLGP